MGTQKQRKETQTVLLWSYAHQGLMFSSNFPSGQNNKENMINSEEAGGQIHSLKAQGTPP